MNNLVVGMRPATVTYLRENSPVRPGERARVSEALTSGTRSNSRGTTAASEEDLQARAKVEFRCKCGEAPFRGRGESVFPVFDAALAEGVHELSLQSLREAIQRANLR